MPRCRDLLDAAKVDGASEWRIFFRIVVPLSTPALATVGLFSRCFIWKDLRQALQILTSAHVPFAVPSLQAIHDVQMLQELAVAQGTPVPHQSVRMAMAVIAIGPVLFAFLFIQKYFIRGITLGGLKASKPEGRCAEVNFVHVGRRVGPSCKSLRQSWMATRVCLRSDGCT
ncbi:MAG: ABC transporter permease subunit [Caldilineaceae bacterium]